MEKDKGEIQVIQYFVLPCKVEKEKLVLTIRVYITLAFEPYGIVNTKGDRIREYINIKHIDITNITDQNNFEYNDNWLVFHIPNFYLRLWHTVKDYHPNKDLKLKIKKLI